MSRPISVLTVLFLLLLAALSAFEALTGYDMLMAVTGRAATARWVVAAASVLLALGLLWELMTRRQASVPAARPEAARRPTAAQTAPPPTTAPKAPQPPAPARPQATGRSGGGLESVMKDGKLTPAAYFMFASEPLSVAAIRKAKAEYGQVLIGFDAGGIPLTGEIENEGFAIARDLGVELEIYVEGPGGKTGDRWDPGEVARVKAAGKSVGIDTSKDGWRDREWDTWGWKAFTFKQLAAYKTIGFNAGEIDNLDRVADSAEPLIALYKEYAEGYLRGELPQLVMKNISAEDTAEVINAINTQVLPRTMFADFHIFECGNSNRWKAVDDISKTVGIRTVPSRDTHHYAAKGKFDLGDEFDAAIERERGPAPPAPIPAPVA